MAWPKRITEVDLHAMQTELGEVIIPWLVTTGEPTLSLAMSPNTVAMLGNGLLWHWR